MEAEGSMQVDLYNSNAAGLLLLLLLLYCSDARRQTAHRLYGHRTQVEVRMSVWVQMLLLFDLLHQTKNPRVQN